MKFRGTSSIAVALLSLARIALVSAGAVCFGACTIACCEFTGGPAAFAGLLGIAIDFTGCAGVCMVACAGGLFVPPACFASDTAITVSTSNGTLLAKPISAIQVNDQVLTLVDGKQATTRVVRNVYSTGRFDFFEFEVRSDHAVSTLKVTPQHSMLLIDPSGEMRFSRPANVSVGDVMQLSDGSRGKVSHIGASVSNEKFTLVTADGSVVASGVLVSTICDEEIQVGAKVGDIMHGWKLKHPYPSRLSSVQVAISI